MGTPEFVDGWDAAREKLRCMIVQDDSVAELLSDRAAPAFFRAFIVEDRATGAVEMKFRWHYKDPDEKSWGIVTTDKRGAEAVEYLQDGLTKVLTTAIAMIAGSHPPEDVVHAFYPPDDGGDAGSTLIWLDMKDLVEITEEAHA
jgi:hypothetical protein